MKKPIILHPFLFAILPILLLYTQNMDEIYISEVRLPIIIALISSFLLWLVLALVLRDRIRAGLLTSCFCLWFLSYGHLASAMAPNSQASLANPSNIFAMIYFAVLVALVILVLFLRRDFQMTNSMLNFAAIGLVAWNIFIIARDEVKQASVYQKAQTAVRGDLANLKAPNNPPNIYYIVLDGYACADVLDKFYGFDNRDFIGYLEQKGLQVAPNGRANYCQTLLSLTSSLNMVYLDELVSEVGADFTSRKPLMQMFQHNQLFSLLKKQGYRTIAFSSDYDSTELRNVDVYLDNSPRPSAFNQLILSITPIPLILGDISRGRKDAPQTHIEKIKYALEHLPDTTQMEAPHFVFAHIVCPHPPFVLDRKGNRTAQAKSTEQLVMFDGSHLRIPRQEYSKAYLEQLRFVNMKLQTTLDEIMTKSKQPPIIIIQSDHGPGSMLDWEKPEKTNMQERLGILLAYYLPGAGEIPTDKVTSPVNVFRLVMNRYFGANLKLLRNDSYYSTWSHPYRFIEVSEKVDKSVE